MTPEQARALLPPEDSATQPEVGGRRLLDAGPSRRGWHHLEAILRCPQQWAFGHHPELRGDPRVARPDAPPLIRGSLLHVGIAHFYRRVQALQEGQDPDQWHTPDDAIAWAAHRADERLTRNPASPWWRSFVAEAQAATAAYVAHVRSRFESFDVVGVEAPLVFRVPVNGWGEGPPGAEGDTYEITMRLDLAYRGSDGLVRFADHKTRGRKDPRQERAYARSGQFQLMRLLGDRLYGSAFGGLHINFVTYAHPADERDRPAPAFKFSTERVGPPVLPFRLGTFEDSVRYGEWLIQMLRPLDPWRYPKINSENGGCEGRYGPCPFAPVCDWGPQGVPVGAAVLPDSPGGR